MNFSLRCARLLLPALMLASAVRAQDATTPLAGIKLEVAEKNTLAALTGAAHDAGAEIGEATDAVPEDAEVLILSSRHLRHLHRDDAAQLEGRLEAFLKKGGSIIFTLPDNGDTFKSVENLLPVNVWPVENNRMARADTGAVAPAGSPLADALGTPGFHLNVRYELHLPYSTREAGQQRYDWERLGKPLLNTDWSVLLNSDMDGELPLLVEGHCFAGKVFIFGGDLDAAELSQWSGYAAFVRALLKCAAPEPPAAAASGVENLKLSIPMNQSGQPLQVEIENPTGQDITAVLAAKVRNLTDSLMNSFSRQISVPAGKTISVNLPETADALKSDIAPRSSDAATPIRRIEAGLCGVDRQEIAVPASGIVDLTPAVTLQIAGQDVRQFPDTEHWAAGGSGFLREGTPLDRYTYFCGEGAKVTIHLRNALHNIAPLAAATDEGWTVNPKTSGLNDGCYNYESLRGLFNGLAGFWAGKSAATQTLQLAWPAPVTITGQRLVAQTPGRGWEKANPLNYTLAAGSATDSPLVSVQNATYEWGRREDAFKPATLSACTLNVTGLDPSVSVPDIREYHANCALEEWEVNGWPDAKAPPAVKGTLVVKICDLTHDAETTVYHQQVSVNPLTDDAVPIDVPTLRTFGQVRVEADFQPETGNAVHADFPLLFIPTGQTHLISRDEIGEVQAAYLCSPGFVSIDGFGTGASDNTQGWGGPDDKVWAWEHDLMEISPRGGAGPTERFLMSPVGMTHYTSPWHDFPSGRYVWDWVTDQLIDRFVNGSWKGNHSIHIVLSDRWNGIPINAEFSWDDLIDFDQYLRAQGKPGLQGKTRQDLCNEVLSQYGNAYQEFFLARYADKMLKSQEKMAAAGVQLTVETHGSFPLAGGEIGEQLGKVDVAVGTDLFWDLSNEDVYRTLGWRFGLVAANPDLRSGAYGQWGWINSELGNPSWFSPSGEVEPSRRQWYATYWTGRITSEGDFQPYTVYGFSYQGGFGTKNTLNDWNNLNRVENTMIWVRPEKPAGFGLVASWPLQEKRMGPEAGRLGFGLYASKGNEQVDVLAGELFQRLMKNGVPISFVASTYTLQKWKGTEPLVVTDGFDIGADEIAQLDRLNRAGAPIIAVGSSSQPDRDAAEALFGVSKTDAGWSAQTGTQEIKDADGQPFAYICRREGRAPTLFCPTDVTTLPGHPSQLLAQLCEEICGKPLTVPPGFAANVFRSEGSLFLLLGSQSDESKQVSVSLRPTFFDPNLTSGKLRVVDMDRARVVPAKWQDGVLTFQVPCAPNDGRMLQILSAQ